MQVGQIQGRPHGGVLMNGNDVAETRTAIFIAHAKEYGLLYAIAYFVASDVGLIATLADNVGGMC